MPFQPVELSTRRLLLRPWRMTDVDDVFAYATDEEWARFLLNVPQPYSKKDAEQFVRISSLDWEHEAAFAIVLDHSVIGGISLSYSDSPANKVASLGYGVGRPYWNQGFVTEATRAVLGYGFGTAGLQKVFATADSRNLGSIRVMEKLGMTREGLLREQRFSRGEYVDEVHYGILQREWFALKVP